MIIRSLGLETLFVMIDMLLGQRHIKRLESHLLFREEPQE